MNEYFIKLGLLMVLCLYISEVAVYTKLHTEVHMVYHTPITQFKNIFSMKHNLLPMFETTQYYFGKNIFQLLPAILINKTTMNKLKNVLI